MAVTAPARRCRTTRALAPVFLLACALLGANPAAAQDTASVRMTGDSVTLRFVDADLRAVVAALGRFLPKTVLAANLPAVRVSLETPRPVSRQTVAVLLQGLVESHGLQFTEDSSYYRINSKPQSVPQSGGGVTGARRNEQDPIELFVIRLRHARAADIAATVNQLFGAGGEFSGQSGFADGTLSDELRRNSLPPNRAPVSSNALGGSAAPRTGNAAAASLAGAVTMVPDPLTNSLLVRAAPADFAVLRAAVDQLDIRPLQVLVEVLIVEARHDRNFSLGVDLTLPRQRLRGDETIEGSLVGGGLGDAVIKLMNLGRANVDAVLRAAQSRGDVEIVSRPVLLASNNVEASFLVGSQRPFVQVSRSLPTDTPTRDQVVQYRDVGTKLSVRPTINQDGYVSLMIQQEINAATSETQFGAPIISTREASTQVLVRDGQTIVLGGLRDQQRDHTSSGIPILSGIPLIGGLFGGSSRRSSRTELYIFLTPRIIRTDAEADSLTIPRLPEEEREAARRAAQPEAES